ncbi:MAG: hypothetical protein M8866_02545 [marine benthic group bacterium]|jgi:hypothetical protein|nr:hypothetical protein [Candidatus Benthicola marisminoris]
MSDRTPAPRRYSEKEVGLILRRATEMQRAEPSAPDPTGLTLDELQEIAAEAGIDPALLRDAATEIQTRRPASLAARLAGAPIKIEVERRVDGELPIERLEDLIPTIQAGTEGQGTASAVGRTLTWSSATDTNMYTQQVLVAVRDGHTLIRMEESLGGLSASLFGGIMGGVGGGVGFGVGGPLAATLGLGFGLIAFPLVAVSGSYLLARAIFTGQARRRREHALDLVRRLADQVERAIPEP